jgi:hypothetical protein
MDYLHRVAAVVLWPLDALRHVPDVVWAALSGAGLAFISTVLSNRNSRKQLQMQLNHDAAQKDRERAMALRRDVYLPATEALARLQGALGQLTNANADQEAIGKQIVTDTATLAKVHLVGSESTIMALMAFQKVFMPAYFELIELRGPLVNRKHAIDLEQTFMDAAIAENKQLVELMRDHNISGGGDAALMQRLKLQSDNVMSRHNTHKERQAALWQEQNVAQLNIADKLGEIMARVAPLIPSALLAARQDVDLPISETNYRRLNAEQQDAALNMLREVVRRGRGGQGSSAPPPAPPPRTE